MGMPTERTSSVPSVSGSPACGPACCGERTCSVALRADGHSAICSDPQWMISADRAAAPPRHRATDLEPWLREAHGESLGASLQKRLFVAPMTDRMSDDWSCEGV